MLLSGFTAAPDATGRLNRVRQRQPFLNMLAFTLRTFAEELHRGTSFFNEHGWQQLKDAIKIRDRLTHPKSMADVEVTEDDFETVVAGSEWYTKTAQPMMMLHKQMIEQRNAAREAAEAKDTQPPPAV